jgi:hypothetical protein
VFAKPIVEGEYLGQFKNKTKGLSVSPEDDPQNVGCNECQANVC